MLRARVLHHVISWALVQYTAGSILDLGTGSGWYPYPPQPQPQPFIPPPPEPVVETPVCLEWGENTVNPLFPLMGPIGGGGGEVDGFGCTGYSIKMCHLGSINTEPVVIGGGGGVGVGGDEIVEVIDDKIVDESTGQIISERRKVFDVTNQYYPNNYNPYGPPPYPYFPPTQPAYPPYFPPPNIGFQTGASRSLGDE